MNNKTAQEMLNEHVKRSQCDMPDKECGQRLEKNICLSKTFSPPKSCNKNPQTIEINEELFEEVNQQITFIEFKFYGCTRTIHESGSETAFGTFTKEQRNEVDRVRSALGWDKE
jgi:hypothetical protein